MTEFPEQMTRRILAELYPTPSPYQQTMEQAAQVVARFGEAIARATALLRLAPAEPCRLCGCWEGHHDGCPLRVPDAPAES